MRRLYLALIILAVVLFLAVSTLLARVFSVEGAERSAVTELVQAEARGDAAAVAGRLYGCGTQPGCRARAAVLAGSLRRPGKVLILQIQPSAGFSLGSTQGVARVAWTVGSRAPVVQCVEVHRAGNALSGLSIRLLAMGGQIKGSADCPSRVTS